MNNKESLALFNNYYRHQKDVSISLVKLNQDNNIIWKKSSNDLLPGEFYNYNCVYLKRAYVINPKGLIFKECVYNDLNIKLRNTYPFNLKNFLQLSDKHIRCLNKHERCPCDVADNYTKYIYKINLLFFNI